MRVWGRRTRECRASICPHRGALDRRRTQDGGGLAGGSAPRPRPGGLTPGPGRAACSCRPLPCPPQLPVSYAQQRSPWGGRARRGQAGTTEGPPVAAITSNRASPSVPSSRNSPGKNTIRSASKKARHGWLQCPGVGPVQPVGCLESGPPRGSRVSATGLCQGHVRHLLLEM